MAEPQVEAKERDVAGPVPGAPGFGAPSFDGGAATSHESAILNLQQTAGNRAVVGLLGGLQRAPLGPWVGQVQRAPVIAGLQRAPAEGAQQLDAAARAERIRFAIRYTPVPRKMMLVDVEAVAAALEGMTAKEGLEVRRIFEEKTRWRLKGLILGNLEIDGDEVIDDIGPKNRRRLAMLLAGTVDEPAPDPIAAMQGAQAVGELVGTILGQDEKQREQLGLQAGAVAAVVVRDNNAEQAKQVGARRRTAQAIQVKTWIDAGRREPIFALLRGLGARERRGERKALADAYEKEFGTTLYISLTRRFKEKTDWDRFDALLFEDDLAKDDRAATEAKLEQVRKAEAAAPKLPSGLEPDELPALMAAPFKEGQKKVRDAKAGLEAHLDEMRTQPAAPGSTAQGGTEDAAVGGGRTRLEAALGEGPGSSAIKAQVGVQTGIKADDLLDPRRRPEVLAARLARKYLDRSIKAGDVETTLRELRETARQDAVREAREAAGKASGATARSPELVSEAYFAQFLAEFETRARKPLLVVLSGLGSAEDRNRNALLLLRQGATDEVTELYFALRSGTKDMDRVRAVLEGKTRDEIRRLAEDYKARTGTDLGTALLGKPEDIRRIRFPTTDDILSGRAPKDLPKARRELDEKLMLLRGLFSYDPSGSVKAQLDFVGELATTRELAGTRGATGAVPLSDDVFGGLAEQVNSQAEREAIRGEAQHVLGRILGREISVEANRGLFARARDAFGNLERTIVKQTRDDALTAIRRLDEALEKDPPDLVAARGQVTALHFAEVRMQHNLGVYDQRTEEAFNAFVDAAVLVASTIATAGAGGVIAGAVRATAATLVTKLLAKGPDYLTSDELLADLRSGVFGAVGGKIAQKAVGRFVEGWAKGIIAKADELGAAAGFRAQAAAGGAKAALYASENIVSGGVSGGLESAVQGNIDPLAQQFSVSSQGMALGQAGAHKVMTAGRGKASARQQKRGPQQAEGRAGGPGDGAAGRLGPGSPDGTPAPAPTTEAAPGPDQAPGPNVAPPTTPRSEAGPTGSADTPPPSIPGSKPGAGADGSRPAGSTGGDSLRAVSPTGPGPGAPGAPAVGGRKPAARTGPRRPERPLSPDEFEVPPSRLTAEQLGIEPDSPLDTPRRRRNREEQLRREGLLPGPDGSLPLRPHDVTLLERSTGATGGRRFAAEFTPIREGWIDASQEVRGGRIEGVVNKLLAHAGMPRVRIVVDPNLQAGNAGFNPVEWTITVSAKDVMDPSPEGFAELANAVAHETRHALHIFRGVRAALDANPAYTAPVRADALARARAVNRLGGFDEAFRLPDRNRPGDRGSLAYGEAVDVIKEAFGPGTPERPTAIGAGQVAAARGQELRTAVDELNAAVAAQPPDPARVQRAGQQVALARYREWSAHNAYVKTAPEADAHRAGPAAGKAVLERLRHEQALVDAQVFARRAAAQLDAAVLSGDAAGIRSAIARAEALQARVREARAALDSLAPPLDGPDLAAHLGAEPMVPPPAQVGVGAAAGTTSASGVPGGPEAGPTSGAAIGSSLQSVKPGAGAGGGKPPGGASRPGGGDQNEQLNWAAHQMGPALEAANARLAAARSARELAGRRLEDARTEGDIGRLELDLALAKAKEGDAEVNLHQAQNMAKRAQRVAEGIVDMGARRQPAAGVAGGGNQPNEMLDWAGSQAGPALEAATAKLGAAQAARKQAEQRLAEARTAGDIGALELEVALAKAKEGDAEVALGDAQNMAVRARRVTEAIEHGRAAANARAGRMQVQPIDDPDVAARMYLEGRGGAGGNLAMARRDVFERTWRDTHHQLRRAPAAGWRRADGSVVIDTSNPRVREAIERLTRQRPRKTEP